MKIKNSVRISLAILAFISIVLIGISSINAALPGIELSSPEPIQNKTSGVFLIDNREVYSNLSEGVGTPISSYRTNNYLFEGEAIHFKVLALDLEGIGNIEDVYFTLNKGSPLLDPPNKKEISCIYSKQPENGSSIISANARLGEEKFDYFNPEIMAVYDCYYVVEDKETVYEEYGMGVEMVDINGRYEQMEENEYWFLNPVLALDASNENSLNFGVRNFGERIYSDVIIIENNAEIRAGVPLNISISGVDLYNSEGQLVECEGTDKFLLKNIKYFASNGAYNTKDNNPDSDNEGYSPISYGEEAIIDNPQGNILTPRAQMALMFRIDIPENCKGSFDRGSVKITGTEPANPNQKVIFELPFSLDVKEKMQLFRIGDILAFPLYGDHPIDREGDYLFEEEVIHVFALGINYGGIENTDDVYITLNDTKKASCLRGQFPQGWDLTPEEMDEYVARETGTLNAFDPSTMDFYDCYYTIESQEEVHGAYQVNVKMLDKNGFEKGLDYPKSFFFNPTITLEVAGDNLSLGEVVAGQRIYTNTLKITTKSDEVEYALLWMEISGEKFYNSLSESINCKNISLSYFASSRDWMGRYYDTFSDPRADGEGYIPLPNNARRVIIQKMGLFTWDRGSVLVSGGEMNLTFRLDIPEECIGNFSGEIDLIGSDYRNEDKKVIAPIIFNLTATPWDKNVSINFNGNLSIISSPINGNLPLDVSQPYLFEGDMITADNVIINVPSGIDKLADDGVFMSVNDQTEVICQLKESISSIKARYLCRLTVETPMSMHGDSIVKIEAQTIYGTDDYIEIGSWFFNPVISLNYVPSSIIFVRSKNNGIAYSDYFQVSNTAEGNASLSLSMSGTNLSNSKTGEICPLSSIKYYAKNKEYNTSSDSRADSEGFLPISYGDRIDTSTDLIKLNDTGRYYVGSSIYSGENITLRFKIDTSQCQKDFDEGNLYLWGSASNYGAHFNGGSYSGSGYPSVGGGIPVSLVTPDCSENIDCNDGNNYTFDQCVNPETIKSYCNHTEITCISNSDCGLAGFSGDGFCQNNSIFKNFQNPTCINSGTIGSYCEVKNNSLLFQACDDNNKWTEDTCITPSKINSTCQHLPIKCFSNKDCGTDGFLGNSFCTNNNKMSNYQSFNCIDPGISQSYCTNKTKTKLLEACKFGCANSICIKDSDNDGVPDNKDKCPITKLPEKFMLSSNHYGDIDGDKTFETISKGRLINSNYSLNSTYGCSCKQILDIKPGMNIGERIFGCTEGTIKDFIKKPRKGK